MLAQIETGRAYQVTHVLNKQYIDIVQIQLMQGIMHHMSIQMTGTTGGDLYRWNTMSPYSLSIILGFKITFHHRNTVPVTQGLYRRFQ